MFIVVAPNDCEEPHLSTVIRQMQRRGPPVIRLVKIEENRYGAIEGSHRMAAAKELGLTPRFVVMTSFFKTSQGFGVSDRDYPEQSVVVSPEQFIENVEDTCGWIGNEYRHDFELV